MCVDTYVMERLMESRLAEARAQSARYALLASLRPQRRNVLHAFQIAQAHRVPAVNIRRIKKWLEALVQSTGKKYADFAAKK